MRRIYIIRNTKHEARNSASGTYVTRLRDANCHADPTILHVGTYLRFPDCALTPCSCYVNSAGTLFIRDYCFNGDIARMGLDDVRVLW